MNYFAHMYLDPEAHTWSGVPGTMNGSKATGNSDSEKMRGRENHETRFTHQSSVL